MAILKDHANSQSRPAASPHVAFMDKRIKQNGSLSRFPASAAKIGQG